MMVATVKGAGASAAVFSSHTDHLSGSNVITNSGGTTEELMDYFPFGEIRLDEKAGSFDEQRKFSGHEHDADTGLDYMNARYYKSDVGRFVSQDPLHQSIGGDMSSFSRKLGEYLAEPQGLNSYSYVMNNPLVYVDPFGLETKVYIENSNVADGVLSIAGHAFVEISRDGESTVYSWSINEGKDYYQNDSDYYGPDLNVTDIKSYLDRYDKVNDTFQVYTFDTTIEQESSIAGYYTGVGQQNIDDKATFNALAYNCVDVVTGALNAGGIVSDSFKATTLGVSTPGSLRSQLDHKYKAQNAGNRFTRSWHNSKSRGITSDITKREVISTGN